MGADSAHRCAGGPGGSGTWPRPRPLRGRGSGRKSERHTCPRRKGVQRLMKLEGKTILITGGGSGIGLELARRLAVPNEGGVRGRNEAKLELARVETPALRTLRLDVTSEEEARRAVAWLSSELDGLDFLVNNAGLLRGYALSSPECG